MAEIYIGVTRTDGSVAHVALQIRGRFPGQPVGGWVSTGQAHEWVRDPTDENIEAELRRIDAMWIRGGDPTMVSWRRLSNDDHEMFNRHRQHRDALIDHGGKIKHDMPKARELHRALLRHQRSERLLALDGKWMAANAKKDVTAITRIEDERQRLRDLPSDPRIEAAQTVADLKLVTVGAE